MESAECRGRILGQREEEKKEREKKGGVRERIERDEELRLCIEGEEIRKWKEEDEEVKEGRGGNKRRQKERDRKIQGRSGNEGGRRKGAEEAPGPFLLVSDLAVEDDIQKFVEVKDGQLAALSGDDSILAPVA